ncbi:MAG: glutamine--fructose-6-phosphate transaminase (isomerizing) [Gammaproteobacteria bacterium]|nr:glutamine--fructose-6-phosphate transaminase (isomerizing) [Gammaproteobacteria bacterium]
MCGIVGAVAYRNVPGILLEGLQRLEYRGYDSAGLAVVTDDPCIDRRRTEGKVAMLADSLRERPVRGTTGIAHTRWATHGVPSEANAHPHLSNGRIALVHNGIIEGFEPLRDEMIAAGYRFESETDAEVIVHLIDYYYERERDLLAAVRSAVQRLEGAYAIGVICRDEPGRMIGARLGSPLVIGVGIEENFIASDVLALRPVTDRFIFLEEGDLVDIRSDSIGVWSAANETVVRATVRVEHVFDEVDKGNYRHHMQREIHEQPRVVRDTLEGRLGRTRVREPAFGVRAPTVLDETDAVTLVACGTAYYAACIARHWIEQYVGIPAQAEIASEWRYRSVTALPRSLFLSLSQSGETADTLAALRIAKQAGFAHTATVCNVPMSSLVRESDMAIMLEAGAEIGVASTKAFTAMLADLLMWTILLGRRRGMTQEREAELVGALHGLADAVDAVLALDDRLRLLAEEFVERRHALFLGRGPHFPVALEGALKLKEISYIHAEGYPAGELKHGPLALVTDEMPVVAVAPNNDLFEKTRSNLQEVRARGGRLYVFADSETGFEEAPGVHVIEVPKVHEAVAPIVYTVPLQLLAYHVAVLKGTDVDQPRNLAKSVTVE